MSCTRIEDFNGEGRGVWETCCQGVHSQTLYREIERRGDQSCPVLWDAASSPFPFPDMAPFTGSKVSFSSSLSGTFDSCRYLSDPPAGTFVYSNPLKKAASSSSPLSTEQQQAMCSMVERAISSSPPSVPDVTSRVFLDFSSGSHVVAPLITRVNIARRQDVKLEEYPCTREEIERNGLAPGAMCDRVVGGGMRGLRFNDPEGCTAAIEKRSVAMKFAVASRFYSWMCKDSKVRSDLFLPGRTMANGCANVDAYLDAAAANVDAANAEMRRLCTDIQDESKTIDRLLDNVLLLTTEGSSARERDATVEGMLKYPQINEAGVVMCYSLPAAIHDSFFDEADSPFMGNRSTTVRRMKTCGIPDETIGRLLATVTYQPCPTCSFDINPNMHLRQLETLWPSVPPCGNREARMYLRRMDDVMVAWKTALSRNPIFRQDDNRPRMSEACESLRLNPTQRSESEQAPHLQSGIWGLEYERWIKCPTTNEPDSTGTEHWAGLGAAQSGEIGSVDLANAYVKQETALKPLVTMGQMPGIEMRTRAHCAKSAEQGRDKLNMFRDNWVTSFGVVGTKLNPTLASTYKRSAITGLAGLGSCRNNIDASFIDTHFAT